MSQLPTVYIISWCRDPGLLYGATMVFASVRTGFPNARIVVVDNGSTAELRRTIFEAARAAECETRAPRRSLPHGRLVERLIARSKGPCVFVDPDVAFWKRVEDWDFGASLLAGRQIPAMDIGGLKMTPRLHTSHLWVPDPARLRSRMADIRRRYPDCGNLFAQWRERSTRLYWDTASALVAALGGEAAAFGEAELDAYDHLFAGSHLESALPAETDPAVLSRLRAWHAGAAADYRSLRGIWREQEALMHACAWREAEPDPATAWMRRDPAPRHFARRLLAAARLALPGRG